MTLPSRLGVVVGLRAEAVLARRIADPRLIEAGGATGAGAERASAALIARGATHLLSFGFAAGLDPLLPAGTVLLPAEVVVHGDRFETDPALAALFGSGVTDPLLHSERLVALAPDKAALRRSSGCAALDMESGAVARAARAAGLPFAVLRAVCDPAGTTLPPAARLPLRADGGLDRGRLLRCILGQPSQLPGLLRLGREVRAAHRALRDRLDRAAAPAGTHAVTHAGAGRA